MDTTLTDSLVGTLLDQRYRVRRRIAQGGMASVYEALDERLERSVAVKVMHAPYAQDPIFIERFIREAKAAAALAHPNIVAVYDQGSDHGITYLVMEKVEGHTLRDVLMQQGRLNVDEALRILEQMLEALAAAHSNRLIHRDVKPENVLISTEGKVKVADFGLARAVAKTQHANTTKGVVMGTVAYVSPEQIMNSQTDPRSDVYAAGIVLYEMLTGKPPFVGQSAVNVAFQHVHNNVPPPSKIAANLPREIDDLVLRATAREPQQRLPHAGEFLDQLRRVQATAGLTAGSQTSVLPTADDQMLRGRATVQEAPTELMRPVDAPTELMPTYGGMTGPSRSHVGPAPTGPGRRRASTSRKPLIIIASLVALGLLAALIGWWVGSGRYTITPGLVNLSKAEAEEKADGVGLSIDYGSPEYSETVETGHVIRQDPGANEDIEQGGTITVVLSKGAERHKVPKLAGMSETEATQALAKVKLKNKVVREHHDSVPRGTVISNDPMEGNVLAPGEYVTLVVSKGAKPIEVPNVVGKTRAEAEQLITARGLQPQVQEVSGGGTPGQVIGQDPLPGTTVSKNQTVTITVVAGLVMPDLTGVPYATAKQQLEALGLRVRRAGGDEDGLVFAQNPAAGSQLRQGERVTLWATPTGNR